jgi:hypothetical protein
LHLHGSSPRPTRGLPTSDRHEPGLRTSRGGRRPARSAVERSCLTNRGHLCRLGGGGSRRSSSARNRGVASSLCSGSRGDGGSRALRRREDLRGGRSSGREGGGALEREAACAWEGVEVAGRPAEEEGRPPAEEPREMSHPILQGKPNASHMCVRIKLHTHDRQ